MTEDNPTAASIYDSLLSRLMQWLASVLIVHLNLAGDLSYHLQTMKCQDDVYWCYSRFIDPLQVYTLLLTLALAWHFVDLTRLKPMHRLLRTATSYAPFSISLVMLVTSLWLYRATTTVGYHGSFETPLPIMVATFALIFLMPILVITKSMVAACCIAKAAFEKFGNR